MSGRDDEWYYEQEAAREAFIESSIKGLSEDNVRSYLGCNGDAINERVQSCLTMARELRDVGYMQPSFVLAVTATEIIIRFFLIRPLLEGAFLSDRLANIIAERVLSGRSAEDRKLLPQILDAEGLAITALHLPDGRPLWDTLTKTVYSKRNRIVHVGEPATSEEASTAISCAECFYGKVVEPIAEKLGFTLTVTNKWSVIQGEADGRGWGTRFVESNPF